MSDRAAISEPPIEPTAENARESEPLSHVNIGPILNIDAPAETASTIEARVRDLEDQVARLRDTRKLEDRVADRVSRRMEKKQSSAAIQVPVAVVAEPSKPPPLAAIAPPPDYQPVVVVEGKGAFQPWLILDIFTEFQAMVRMFLDARYRVFCMTWQTKVYPPLLLGLMVVSWVFISSITLVGPALDKIAELILAFFLYKVLSREAGRYKEIGPQIRR